MSGFLIFYPSIRVIRVLTLIQAHNVVRCPNFYI
jgi:hypothetical protein